MKIEALCCAECSSKLLISAVDAPEIKEAIDPDGQQRRDDRSTRLIGGLGPVYSAVW